MEITTQAKAIKSLLVKGGIAKTEVNTCVGHYGTPNAFILVEASAGIFSTRVLPAALAILRAKGYTAELDSRHDQIHVAVAA